MTRIFHDSDADLAVLAGQRLVGVQSDALFERVRAARDELPWSRWERSAREAFRIGDARRMTEG